MSNAPIYAASKEANDGEVTANLAPVIICDDHIAIRAGVARILEERGIEVAGECFSVASLLDFVGKFPDAIVITDLAVDDVPFPILVGRIREKSAQCQVIVYSMREAPATIGLCYESGAIAFIPKRSEPDEIIKAVENARRGERYFPVSVASNLANFHIDGNAPSNALTTRELDIFIRFAKEESVEQIAEELEVSEKTVQNSLSTISKKLDVPRTNFYQVARRYGLLDFG